MREVKLRLVERGRKVNGPRRVDRICVQQLLFKIRAKADKRKAVALTLWLGRELVGACPALQLVAAPVGGDPPRHRVRAAREIIAPHHLEMALHQE